MVIGLYRRDRDVLNGHLDQMRRERAAEMATLGAMTPISAPAAPVRSNRGLQQQHQKDGWRQQQQQQQQTRFAPK